MSERVRLHWVGRGGPGVWTRWHCLGVRATELSRTTIPTGIRQLKTQENLADVLPMSRARRPGGDPKPIEETDPTLLLPLKQLVALETRGDLMSPLRWTLKTTSQLAAALTDDGHHGVGADGRRVTQGLGLQPAGQPQDT